MIHEPLTSLISLCTWADRDVWNVSSNLIPKLINATDYKVYIPQIEYKKLSKLTGKGILVLPETELDLSFFEPLRRELLLVGNERRYI